MQARTMLPLAAATAIAIPTLALADGIPAHSSFYGTSKSDVTLLVHRDSRKADVSVRNSCIGSQTFGTVTVPLTASATSVAIRNGKIAYKGSAKVFTKGAYKKIPMVFKATIAPTKATGTAQFPKTKCKRISFSAKLKEKTP